MTAPSDGAHGCSYTFGPFSADPKKGILHRDGKPVVLASKSFEVLIILIERRDRVVEKDELLKLAWKDTFVEENNLARHISTLRKALSDDPHDPAYITTVAGQGYRFVAPVTEQTAPGLTSAPEQPGVPVRVGWPSNRVALAAAAVLVAGALTTFVVATRVNRDALQADRKLWQLTTGGGLESEPSWAPDGQRLAYSSDRSGNFDIWTQSTSDDHSMKLTSSTADDWQPSWSPDGRQIAFRSERDDGGIFVVPAAGGEERRITRFGYKPQWSRVGSTLLFYDSNVVSKLYIVDESGSSLRRVLTDFLRTFGPFRAAWHPDGKRISIYGNHKREGWSLWTVSPDGGAPIRSHLTAEVLTRIRTAGLSFTEFSWSPAGDALYFEGRSENAINIWRVGVDPRSLEWRSGPERLTTGGGLDANIVLSPDGRRLAFSVRNERTRVWSVPFDATNGTILGLGQPISPLGIDAVYPHLPPGGRMLLYRTSRRGKQELWRQTLPDGPSHRMVVDDQISHPRWSADGRFVAYRRADSDGKASGIVVVSAESGTKRPLTTPGVVYRAPYDWSRDGSWILGACEHGSLGLRSVCLLPVSGAPRAESQMRVIASDPERNLFQGTFSPNEEWIAFEAADRSTSSTIYVVRTDGGRWIPITEGGFWDDKPRWSPDGRAIYFMSNRQGFFDVWGRRFDPQNGRVGEAFRITNFKSPRQRVSTPMLTTDLSISEGHMVLPIVESSGEIWILESVGR